jgi:hypothetical protein
LAANTKAPWSPPAVEVRSKIRLVGWESRARKSPCDCQRDDHPDYGGAFCGWGLGLWRPSPNFAKDTLATSQTGSEF